MRVIRQLWLAVAIWRLWRQCDWVYRWAHHPLCERFRRDVWRVGPMHICRSCTLMYGSACASLLLGLAVDGQTARAVVWLLMAIVLPPSHPRFYRRWPRWMRDALRSGAGIIFGLLLALLLRGGILIAMIHLAALTLIAAWYQRARRPAIAAACDGCPELAPGRTCSGFRLQTQRILAFEPAATEMVIHAGLRPGLYSFPGRLMEEPGAPSSPIIRCRRCDRPYSLDSAGALASCPHCGASARPILRDNRIAAILALLALAVLTAGIFLPFVSMSKFGVDRSYSLIGGIIELYERDYHFLGSILLVFSVIFPYAKLMGLLLATSALVNLSGRARQRLHHLAAITGRYSLLDILVVAVMIVVIRFEQLVEIRAEAGTILFGVAVFMSIAAGFCVDVGSGRRSHD